MKQGEGWVELVSRLKRAFRVLFKLDGASADNTIYCPDPDNFGSFLEVDPIWNVPTAEESSDVEVLALLR